MSNKELKPCPFCGGEVWINYTKKLPTIKCDDCNMRLKNWSYKELVTLWNTRTDASRHELIKASNER